MEIVGGYGRAAALVVVTAALVGSVLRVASAATLTDGDLRQLAVAHAVIEERAAHVYPRVDASRDPAADLTGADRRVVEEALRGSGVSFEEFARIQRQLMVTPDAMPRFFALEQEVKADRQRQRSGVPRK
jgi:hypothetical protein